MPSVPTLARKARSCAARPFPAVAAVVRTPPRQSRLRPCRFLTAFLWGFCSGGLAVAAVLLRSVVVCPASRRLPSSPVGLRSSAALRLLESVVAVQRFAAVVLRSRLFRRGGSPPLVVGLRRRSVSLPSAEAVASCVLCVPLWLRALTPAVVRVSLVCSTTIWCPHGLLYCIFPANAGDILRIS